MTGPTKLRTGERLYPRGILPGKFQTTSAKRVWMAQQNYAKLGQVKCRKSNLEAISLLSISWLHKCMPNTTITTACILNRICTIGYLSYHLCHEIFGANPNDLMVGGKQRSAALGFIHDRMNEFVTARVFEPAEEKQYPYPRAHATSRSYVKLGRWFGRKKIYHFEYEHINIRTPSAHSGLET